MTTDTTEVVYFGDLVLTLYRGSGAEYEVLIEAEGDGVNLVVGTAADVLATLEL